MATPTPKVDSEALVAMRTPAEAESREVDHAVNNLMRAAADVTERIVDSYVRQLASRGIATKRNAPA
jgi:hypothetical protein